MTMECLRLRACLGTDQCVRCEGRWHLCLQLYMAVLCVLVFFPGSSQEDDGKQLQTTVKEVKLLMAEWSDLTILELYVNLFFAGLDASLSWRDNLISGNVRVKIIRKKIKKSDFLSVIEKEFQQDEEILALVGFFGDKFLLQLMDVLGKNHAVAFAPLTGSSSVRKWSLNVYFLAPDPAAEVLAFVRYALQDLRVHRLGFMYLKEADFGVSEYKQAKRLLSEQGYELSCVFSVISSFYKSANDDYFNAEWEKFANCRPQAVIVFASPIGDTAKFILRLITDNRTSSAYLLAPSAVRLLVLTIVPQIIANGGTAFRAEQLILSGITPLASDTTHKDIIKFQRVMQDYLEKNENIQDGIGKNFPNDYSKSDLMLVGWLTGEVLFKTLSNREWLTSRKTFQRSLFDQRRYVLDEFVFGDYGGECSEAAADNGATCYCNQGGRTVYISRFANDGQVKTFTTSFIKYRVSECNASFISLPSVLNAVIVIFNDQPLAIDAFSQLKNGDIAAMRVTGDSQKKKSFSLHPLLSLSYNASDTLLAEIDRRRVHTVVGVVTEAMLDVPDVTFIDPLLLEPRLSRYRKRVIHLSPTLEQQFFVLAQYLGNTGGASAHVVVRGGDGAAVADVLLRSLATFGGSLLSTTLLAEDDPLEGCLPQGENVFVVGLGVGDADVVARHVAAHSGVRVFVAFSELAVLHAGFVAAFDGGDGADHVVFATNLPHWDDPKTTSATALKFIAAMPDRSERTPLSFMAFTNVRLAQTVASRMDRVSGELLADFFYKNVAVAVDDMVYGPFADDSACITGGTRCAVNYGATSIAVWSLSRSINPLVPPLAAPVTPSMDYSDPNAGRLTGAQLTGIIAGCVLAAALLAAVVAVLLWCCRDSRDNRNAPKERMAPVTLVFTDIESSTALWAACPKEMADAVAAHHRVIRSLIKKYNCYEVKTVGDSFMIADRSVFAAVQLVRELQQVFLRHDWGTTAFDDAYRAFEERRAAEDEEGEYVPPTARLDADVYQRYWNGLRVRVGVHTGLCDIRYDSVTKGYDYFGDTSNTAARTESVANGGQVLLTRAAYMALSTAERAQVDVTLLGAVALRGVPLPVEMYQLDAVTGRTFAALRLEREINYLREGTESNFLEILNPNDNLSSVNEKPFFCMMTDLFGPLSLSQRERVLEALCERWGLSFCSDKMDNSAEYNVTIGRLAEKLARVSAHNANMDGVRYNSELFAFFGGSRSFELASASIKSNKSETNAILQQCTDVMSQHESKNIVAGGRNTSMSSHMSMNGSTK